jgi:hypothetical protein
VASDITGVGSQISARFQLVNVVPATALVVYVAFVVSSGALTASASIDKATEFFSSVGWTEVVVAAALVLILGTIINPFQTKMIKVLEGYWKPAGMRGIALDLSIERQRQRRLRYLRLQEATARKEELGHSRFSAWHRAVLRVWERVLTVGGASADALDGFRTVSAARLRDWYADRYDMFPAPQEDESKFDAGRLMPTRLGNALRAHEDRAGDRFGFDAVKLIPYAFGVATADQIELLDDARLQLDVAVKFVWTWSACTAIGLIAFANDGPWLLIPVTTMFLTGLSYSASISAAQEYGVSLLRVVDLHRFDILKQLHWKLPESPSDEVETFQTVVRLLEEGTEAQGRWPRYVHSGSSAPPDDA